MSELCLQCLSVLIMPQCKASGCFNGKGKVEKSVYQFPDPLKSTDYTCIRGCVTVSDLGVPLFRPGPEIRPTACEPDVTSGTWKISAGLVSGSVFSCRLRRRSHDLVLEFRPAGSGL